MKHFLAFATILTLLTTTLSGQTNPMIKENSLTVRGIAILKQSPQVLSARITVKVNAEKFNPCQEKLVNAIDRAKSVFLKSGIDRKFIRTNDLSVTEKRDYLNDGQIKTSFEGNSLITIEHMYSADYAKKLLSALQNDSIAFLYNLEFSLSEDQKSELRQMAIKAAIKDAREKAEAIAKAANIELLKINTITFNDEELGRFYESDLVQENIMFSRDVAMSKPASSAPVIDFNPKEIGIKKSLIIEWLIGERK
jgi:uncharacterized protein YggE